MGMLIIYRIFGKIANFDDVIKYDVDVHVTATVSYKYTNDII